MTTRVCIADGVAVFRAAVREVLRREKDFSVVEAPDVETFDVELDRGIDIALLANDLPPAGASVAISLAAGRCTELIVWSLNPEPREVLAAIQAGATGYLRKEISPVGLVRSLRGAAHGESPLSRDLTAFMIDAIHNVEAQARARERAAGLSSREREVLTHMAHGLRNRQIAAHLAISEFTVKRHVQNILHKLELPSRRAAAAFHRSIVDVAANGEREAV